MMHYVGIDLGTTNSVICSYDGLSAPQIWKSPEQNNVTPSAIYIGKRGNRYYGSKAYNMAAVDAKNSAVLFKRYLGTSTKFDFADAGLSLSPEECSAEILRVLFGYLPEEIRNAQNIGTVITVPAAFNQVKKEATLSAARMAGIGNVALMQEPVAAIMSVMQSSKGKSGGVFVIYDLGGGTFDISIAESTGGKVNLLLQEGKEMCGGRDWDRKIFDSIVTPWLRDNFSLPDNFLADEKFRRLRHVALFAIEQAKIELSLRPSSQDTIIQAEDLFCKDTRGKDMYLDVRLSREALNPLIDGLIDETIGISRAAMKKAGFSSSDVERLIFIGGPTKYGYLREKVSSELAVRTDAVVDPMTAVAEGACIFAESIDWNTEDHRRKIDTDNMKIGTNLSFRYEKRASGNKARVLCRLKKPYDLMFEIISNETGWSSGRLELRDGTLIELPLTKDGDNSFRVAVYDKQGRQIPIPESRITITKTMAAVGAIPASHSIAISALDKLGGAEKLVYLVKKDEALPKKGRVTFRAAQTLKASTDESLNFHLWEGEIETPYEDNRFVGVYKISGSDLSGGEVIPAGSEIVCGYEISDGGALSMSASAACLGTEFARKNFYFHDEAKMDLSNTERLAEEGREIIGRIDDMSLKIDDPNLDRAREKAEHAASIDTRDLQDEEEVQEAYNDLYEAKKILSRIRTEHFREVNEIELEHCIDYFTNYAAKYASESESASFNNLARTARRFVNDSSFERYIKELWQRADRVLVRQDWFIIDYFRKMTQNPEDFYDVQRFGALKSRGVQCIEKGDIDELRRVISGLIDILKNVSSDDKRLNVNIIKG